MRAGTAWRLTIAALGYPKARARRSSGLSSGCAELVDEYLAQHDGKPETIETLRWPESRQSV